MESSNRNLTASTNDSRRLQQRVLLPQASKSGQPLPNRSAVPPRSSSRRRSCKRFYDDARAAGRQGRRQQAGWGRAPSIGRLWNWNDSSSALRYVRCDTRKVLSDFHAVPVEIRRRICGVDQDVPQAFSRRNPGQLRRSSASGQSSVAQDLRSREVGRVRIVLDVFPDVFAWGVLLLPKELKPGEQRPVVVCQHDATDCPSTSSKETKRRITTMRRSWPSGVSSCLPRTIPIAARTSTASSAARRTASRLRCSRSSCRSTSRSSHGCRRWNRWTRTASPSTA